MTIHDPDRVAGNLARLGALSSAFTVCRQYGVEPRLVFGKCRTVTVARCRWHIWTLLRHTLVMSYPEIARVWDVDHTTVLMGVRKRETMLAEEHAA